MAKYTSRPEVVKKRVEQNKARRMMEKAGKVRKGDGKDVDHKTPLSKGGKTTPGNLRVVNKSTNRSFSRNKNGGFLRQMSKKERT